MTGEREPVGRVRRCPYSFILSGPCPLDMDHPGEHIPDPTLIRESEPR